jgi:hypothetical protein
MKWINSSVYGATCVAKSDFMVQTRTRTSDFVIRFFRISLLSIYDTDGEKRFFNKLVLILKNNIKVFE